MKFHASNYKVSLSKLNVNACKCEFASTKTQHLTLRVISFISSKIRGSVQNTSALSQVLFIITFQEWSREQEEESWCRGVWSPCFGSPKKTIRYNRSLDGGTQHRTTEDSVLSMSSVRLTRMDGIKSSEAREGRRGKLKFPIASTASRPILRVRRN